MTNYGPLIMDINADLSFNPWTHNCWHYNPSIPVYILKKRKKQGGLNLSTKFYTPGSRKEVFQPHLPVRLPCYDLTLVTRFTLGRSLRLQTSGTPSFHGLTGGVYKARERIHRIIADIRLLAIPTSWSRVADSNPNWDRL